MGGALEVKSLPEDSKVTVPGCRDLAPGFELPGLPATDLLSRPSSSSSSSNNCFSSHNNCQPPTAKPTRHGSINRHRLSCIAPAGGPPVPSLTAAGFSPINYHFFGREPDFTHRLSACPRPVAACPGLSRGPAIERIAGCWHSLVPRPHHRPVHPITPWLGALPPPVAQASRSTIDSSRSPKSTETCIFSVCLGFRQLGN